MIQAVERFLTPTTTPRQLGKDFAFCGFGAMPLGTPDIIADVIEEWINIADIDGFIVSCQFVYFPAELGVFQGVNSLNPRALARSSWERKMAISCLDLETS
jgi:alkanesulfonate monooxygenase SsuD/methylene tetrahydromethanopterin reductase-like flavin-dependent oxidoreductase (luciferase family)